MKLSATDLNYIFNATTTLWDNLRNQRLFITGGTGFFGCWLLESLTWANKILQLNTTAVVLTRNCELFKKKCPHLFEDPSLIFHEGDVTDFNFLKVNSLILYMQQLKQVTVQIKTMSN